MTWEYLRVLLEMAGNAGREAFKSRRHVSRSALTWGAATSSHSGL
jgi:hypothetical protein